MQPQKADIAAELPKLVAGAQLPACYYLGG